MNLRVVHVIPGLEVGGAEKHLVNLMNSMSCEFRAVVLVGPQSAGPSFEAQLDPGIELHRCRVRRRSLPLGIWRLAKILRRLRCQVVHCHMYEANLFASIAARIAGVPLVVTTEHGENPWKNAYHHWIERTVISRLVDVRFSVSQRILELRRDESGVPEAKLRLVFNGTPLPRLTEKACTNEPLVLGAVGRFIPEKDYARLLEAVAELRRRGLQCRACIVGDGPEMGRLRDLLKDLKLADWVELPGMVTDVDRWYRSFDIYVSASFLEGQPVAMLEAMAYGLPIVATDVGASAETLGHGESGLVVPPCDTAALADGIGTLLGHRELRKRLGRNARTRVESHYSIDAVADSHLRCYRELLIKKGSISPQSVP